MKRQNPAYRLAVFLFKSSLVANRIQQLIAFVLEGIWRIRGEQTHKRQFFLIRILRVVVLAIRKFINEKFSLKASALTYYSLLSIVPMAAMAFGIAKGFGFESALESQLIKSLYGREEVVAWIMDFAHKYLSSIKGGMIAGVGFVILLWSAMNLLGSIEMAFNEIWEVKRSRSFVRKFSDYVSIMLIGILFLVSSGSMVVSFTDTINNLVFFRQIWLVLSNVVPYVLVWIMFTMLYYILPNTKIKFGSALVGGIIAGTAFQATQYLYIYFQVGVSRYNAVYGSFAAFPLFLMWMQISWLIVLFGAGLSFAHQNVRNFEFEKDTSNISYSYRRMMSVYIARFIIDRFAKGQKAPTFQEIVSALQLPVKLCNILIYEMIEAGLVSEIYHEKNYSNTYQPALDISTLTVHDFIARLESYGSAEFKDLSLSDFEKVRDVVGAFAQAAQTCPSNVLLKDI